MSDRLLRELFAAIDAMDGKAFGACLTDDCRFRFGSAAPVSGRADIVAAVDAFFDSLAGLSHELHEVVTDGDLLVVEGVVTYLRHDGKKVPVPFADTFRLDGGKIDDYRIYADLSPLYAS